MSDTNPREVIDLGSGAAHENQPSPSSSGRCNYMNAHGVHCGLPPHPSSVLHELDEQLVSPDPFCLQPHDPFTLALIRGWISAAHAHKVPAEKIQRAEQHFKDIKRWQETHRTKLPD